MTKKLKIKAQTGKPYDRVVTCEYDYTAGGAWIIRCRAEGFRDCARIARPCVYSLRHWKSGKYPGKGEEKVVAAAIEWYESAVAELEKGKHEPPPGRPENPAFHYLGYISSSTYAVGIRYDWNCGGEA